MIRKTFLMIVVSLMLNACGELPRPFGRDASDSSQMLATALYFEGVEVAPLTGTTPPMGKMLAAAVIKRLEKKYEIPAAMEGFDRSHFVLNGNVIFQENASATMPTYSISWLLSSRAKGAVSTFVLDVPATKTEWDYGSPPILDHVGDAVSERVAMLVLGDRFNTAGQDRTLGRNGVLVSEVTGAPGDGNASLRRAMAVALGGGGLKIARNPDEALFTVSAKVDIDPPVKGAQSVRILWLVKDVGGEEIGRAEQANAVPAGSLDGKWGRTAAFVAAAAMDGIMTVIDRHNPNKLRAPDLGSGLRSDRKTPDLPTPKLRRVPGRALPPPN